MEQYLLHDAPNYGDGDATCILDMLYNHYREFNQFESAASKDHFDALYCQLERLPLKELDVIIDIVCGLCVETERAAFTEGIKVGVRMGLELIT